MHPRTSQDSGLVYGTAEVITAINELELELLERDWVHRIWRDKFTECPSELPDAYSEKFSESDTTVEILDQAQHAINEWLASSDAENNWESLKELDYKSLLALVYFCIKNATTNPSDTNSIVLGIKATEFYMNLLLIPGSKVYNIFHVAFYDACMETFLIFKHLDDNFSDHEARSIIKNLNKLLSYFINFIKKFSLKSNEALRITMSSLAELTRAERKISFQNSGPINDKKSIALYAKNAYAAFKCICDEFHGRPNETIRLVFVQILPNLSMVGGSSVPNMSQWPAQEQNTVRANAQWFITNNLASIGEPFHQNLKILIQHLMRAVPNRAEQRPKFIECIIAFILLLPQKLFFEMHEFIFRDALSNTVSQRVVALELISKLIYLKQGNTEQTTSAETSVASSSAVLQVPADIQSESSVCNSRVISFSKPLTYLPIEYRRAMLAIICDRIRDGSASISAKAINILKDLISNKSSITVNKLIASVFLDPYSESYDQEPEVRGFANTKNLASWEHDKIAEITAELMPSGKIIIEFLHKYLLVSNRYLIRKAANNLLLQLFKLNPYWMTNEWLSEYAKHCRDPSKQLRKEMIKMLTELLIHYPDHPLVLKYWVSEVVPTVDDPEDTVVDETLRVMKEVILDNVKPFSESADDDEMSLLPWKVLTKIGTMKMRTFLKLACVKWQRKKDVWNQAKIAAIVTHINSKDYNSAAWCLLASLSEFVDIANPQPILDYYFNNLDFDENSNTDICTLVLLTLHNSWTMLKKASQLELQKQLMENLRLENVLPNLVPTVVKIATGMAVAGAEDVVLARKEIAAWAKETAKNCEDHFERCIDTEAASGCCKKCSFHMILLSSIADLHPDQINPNTFDVILRFLTTSKPEPSGTKFRAAAVLMLGRAALLDNVLACRLIQSIDKLLCTNSEKAVLNNVIICFADIGERFPNLIEPLVPTISMCLKHQSREIRELTLIVIVDLLKEDFLRAKSALLYNLLSLVNDKSPQTIPILKSYLQKRVEQKKSSANEIIMKCMFQYNKYDTHPLYKLEQLTSREERMFQMNGPKNRVKRYTVYRFLLSMIKMVDRLCCANEICQVIFNGIGDEIIRTDTPAGEELLLDTFQLLLCPEMQAEDKTKNKDNDRDEDDAEEVKTIADKQNEVLVQAIQEKLLETMIPLCSKMKKAFSRNRKSCSRLYIFLREFLRDSKKDIMELFRDDRQFGEEIAHEIKHTERTPPEQWFIDVETEVAPPVAQPTETPMEIPKPAEEPVENIPESSEANVEVSVSRNSAPGNISRKRQQRSGSAQELGEPRAKRSTRFSSAVEISESQKMPPPSSTVPTRLSRRAPNTPSVPSKPHLLHSSTPLLANPTQFEDMDISPVLETDDKTTE